MSKGSLMDLKKAFSEDLKEEENAGSWRKRYSCYVVKESLATMSPAIRWKIRSIPIF